MQTEQPIINGLPSSETPLIRASIGQRLANYIIDMVACWLFLMVITVIITLLIILISPSMIEKIDAILDDDVEPLDRVIGWLLYGLYMGSVEALFKGKSLGKLITKTRAVNTNGSAISTSTAFKRGFVRIAPFCALSALKTPCVPWQDRWTDTMVVDEKLSKAPVK